MSPLDSAVVPFFLIAFAPLPLRFSVAAPVLAFVNFTFQLSPRVYCVGCGGDGVCVRSGCYNSLWSIVWRLAEGEETRQYEK
jgi:hypothetical protein